jgi:hypothetical protein
MEGRGHSPEINGGENPRRAPRLWIWLTEGVLAAGEVIRGRRLRGRALDEGTRGRGFQVTGAGEGGGGAADRRRRGGGERSRGRNRGMRIRGDGEAESNGQLCACVAAATVRCIGSTVRNHAWVSTLGFSHMVALAFASFHFHNHSKMDAAHVQTIFQNGYFGTNTHMIKCKMQHHLL